MGSVDKSDTGSAVKPTFYKYELLLNRITCVLSVGMGYSIDSSSGGEKFYLILLRIGFFVLFGVHNIASSVEQGERPQ